MDILSQAQIKRVLVVEDEGTIRQLIVLHLRREGFAVDEVGSGEQARGLMQMNPFDLVILDWMLPGMSGLEITRWMRQNSMHQKTPILFVTAKVEPEHIASGLDAGADDYLTKPFDTLVLMARVNALLRRHQWQQVVSTGRKLKVGELSMDQDSFEVSLAGQPLELTKSEFKLLASLVANQGKVLSRESLIEEIQGEGVNVVGRTVDTHVFGLRKKLGEYGDFIETIRGVGYRVRHINS
jgi:DNA-binding response OmpR family regulator